MASAEVFFNSFNQYAGHVALTLALLFLVVGPRPLRPPFALEGCLRWMVWLDAIGVIMLWIVENSKPVDLVGPYKPMAAAEVFFAVKDGCKFAFMMYRCGFEPWPARVTFVASITLYVAYMSVNYGGAPLKVVDIFLVMLYIFWTLVDFTTACTMAYRLRHITMLTLRGKMSVLPEDRRHVYEPILLREQLLFLFASLGMTAVTITAILRVAGVYQPIKINRAVFGYAQVLLAAPSLVGQGPKARRVGSTMTSGHISRGRSMSSNTRSGAVRPAATSTSGHGDMGNVEVSSLTIHGVSSGSGRGHENDQSASGRQAQKKPWPGGFEPIRDIDMNSVSVRGMEVCDPPSFLSNISPSHSGDIDPQRSPLSETV